MNKGAYIEENPDGGLGRRNLTNEVREVQCKAMTKIINQIRVEERKAVLAAVLAVKNSNGVKRNVDIIAAVHAMPTFVGGDKS